MAGIKEERAQKMIRLIGLTRFVHWIIGIVLLATLGGKGYFMLFPVILFCILSFLYYMRHSLTWTTNKYKYTVCIWYLILLAIIPVFADLTFGGFKKVGSGPIGADLAKKVEKKSKADLAKKEAEKKSKADLAKKEAEKNSQAEPSKAEAGVYGETIPYVWWGMITLELVLKIVWFKFHKKNCYPPCFPLY
jgi:hypothetical protein